jgi:hypothetical protein
LIWNYFLNEFLLGFWIFSFLILRSNHIGNEEAEEVSKGISSLAKCPLTNFSLDLRLINKYLIYKIILVKNQHRNKNFY